MLIKNRVLQKKGNEITKNNSNIYLTFIVVSTNTETTQTQKRKSQYRIKNASFLLFTVFYSKNNLMTLSNKCCYR